MALPPDQRLRLCAGRRFVLQPGALPPAARLSAQLGMLRAQAAELADAGCASAERDFADVLLRAGGSSFRWRTTVILTFMCYVALSSAHTCCCAPAAAPSGAAWLFIQYFMCSVRRPVHLETPRRGRCTLLVGFLLSLLLLPAVGH